MKKKKFTKIRENITEIEYQKLLTYLNGKEDLTTNCFGYIVKPFSVNEVQSALLLTLSKIKELC